MAHLKDCFSEFLQEMYEITAIQSDIFSTQNLKDHIQKQLKNKVSFVNICNKGFVMSSAIDIEAISDEDVQDILFQQEAQDFAIKYRRHVLKIKKHALPDLIDSAVLEKGECEIPKWLNLFWETALNGVGKKTGNRVKRLSSCFAQDSIYSITRGTIKPLTKLQKTMDGH